MKFTTTQYAQFTILPPDASQRIAITASVGFVSPESQPDMLVVIKNKRGWDIPGGHVETDETPLQAFERELMEEAGCQLLQGTSLTAILQSNNTPTTGIAVYRGMCCPPAAFAPQFETEASQLITASDLLDIYFGDEAMLQELMVRAEIAS